MIRRLALLACLPFLFAAESAAAQERTSAAYTGTSDLDDVRPFRAWVTDAVFTRGVDVEPQLIRQDFDGASVLIAGARLAAWVADGFELGGDWSFASIDPENGDGDSGLRDLGVYGRYRIPVDESLVFAVGGESTIPFGDESVGGGALDFRGFGALRYDADGNLTFLANAGIESVERFDDHDLGLFIGGGTIVPLTEETAIIAEIDISTATDASQITAGVDYELPPGGHLRAAIGLGLDDDAPNWELIFGFAIPVY